MVFGDDAIRALREALRVSPDNVPLRQHLAQTLIHLGRCDEAEQELRAALSAKPQDGSLKLDLANLFYQQGKTSQALVIVEDLTRRGNGPAPAHLLHARLLFKDGNIPAAVAQYKLALEIDPAIRDAELSERLGVSDMGQDDSQQEVVDGQVRESVGSGFSRSRHDLERPQLTFKDVGGMDELKEEINLKIVYPLQHAEMYRAYGKAIGGGILMYGPPGCGKTYLARATAGEIHAQFLSIGINDVLDMWIGNSERNLHEIFEQARSNKPCVLFFDEVDALGGRRSDMQSGAGRNIINQFLSELDGVQSTNDGLLVLAATNAPWHVDPAFRRPGRFDQVLFVPPPDHAGRVAIARVHMKNKPTEGIDYEAIAGKTEGFSGADLKAIVDKAIEYKLREAMKTGRPQPLTTKDLLAAAKELRSTTREWFSTARNYALYSNQGGAYDAVLKYLKL